MSKLVLKQDPRVKAKFKSYPKDIEPKIMHLRDLILETASANDSIAVIEETLKWGEPSYLTKKGSTIRIDWKEKTPGQYAIYFKCTSKLVPTFKKLYGDNFNYENNRAILFKLNEKVPEKQLKECIAMALQYHLLKDKALLGMKSPD